MGRTTYLTVDRCRIVKANEVKYYCREGDDARKGVNLPKWFISTMTQGGR